jgi:hypothetical protein
LSPTAVDGRPTGDLVGKYSALLLAALAATSIGCGNGKVTVQGEVTFDGQPVEQGTIIFEPADGEGPSAGGKVENGKYSLAGEAGLLPGVKIVRIKAFRKTGRQVEAGPPSPPGTMVEEIERLIPDCYNGESTLTCEVAPGEKNEHNFHLQPP